MNRERFEELCSAYVLGSLDRDEAREFQNALQTAQAELHGVYVEMKKISVQLPAMVDEVQPPPALKERILRQVRRAPRVERARERRGLASLLGFDRPNFALGFAILLMLISISLGYYVVLLRDALETRDREISAVQDQLSVEQTRFSALQGELERKQELLNIIQSPKIDIVIMNGLEVNPAGYGKIIWDPDKKQAILQISNLPPVPKDKDYQLWVIKGKVPVSAGVFTVNDPSKESLFKIDRLVETDKKAINAFAITLEPKGGVPQPTGAMYLMGTPSL